MDGRQTIERRPNWANQTAASSANAEKCQTQTQNKANNKTNHGIINQKKSQIVNPRVFWLMEFVGRSLESVSVTDFPFLILLPVRLILISIQLRKQKLNKKQRQPETRNGRHHSTKVKPLQTPSLMSLTHRVNTLILQLISKLHVNRHQLYELINWR